jgi:hypothetical protein
MRTRTSWLALLLSAGVALAPGGARGQDYFPPDPVVPLPLYHDRPETGGLFVAGEFMFFRQTNPLKPQTVAFRGIRDFDGSINADIHGTTIEPLNGGPPFILPNENFRTPGAFIGSAADALNTQQVRGPQTFEPGFKITMGWRFEGGATFEASWFSLLETKYNAVASIAPPSFNPGVNLADSFITSPVFNFPNDFAGPANKIALGNPGAAFGIWDAASVMTEVFVQRFDQFDMTARIPIVESDCNRCYGLIGPRVVWIWENFKWRTVAEDFTGQSEQDWAANYSNTTSNALWGAHVGFGDEWRLGDSPMGTFSLSLDLNAAAFMDFVHEEAKYERQDFFTASKISHREVKPAGELEAQLNLWWYPIEGVQIRIGYDAMGFFNTVASPYPVDFNYSLGQNLWRDGEFRFIDGVNLGIGFIF